MAKDDAGLNKATTPNLWTQAIQRGNLAPTWAQYQTTGTMAVPNISWQNTSSGATYCSASSVLKP